MKIGVLGGGQLGRMLALAGAPLDLDLLFLDPSVDACAGHIGELVIGTYDELDMLSGFAEDVDVITFEFENIPAEAADHLAKQKPLYPGPAALHDTQDRLTEKTIANSLDIATAKFAEINSEADLRQALDQFGFPAVLKTRRLGYDGKGQIIIKDEAQIAEAWQELQGQELILEQFIAFQRELSLLSTRDQSGAIVFYPLVENMHKDGILRVSRAPATVDGSLREQAEQAARTLLNHWGYVGTLAIEFFEQEGTLLLNEVAPRVHNSGHWTIEGAETSQFENHLRAVCGLPLGSTAPRGYSAMINIIGTLPKKEDMLSIPGAHLHLYGKEPRPGRKIGHVTVCHENREKVEELIEQVVAVLS